MKLNVLAGDFVSIPPEHADLEVAGLTADSRNVQPGFVFAALPGHERDGTDYIADAVHRGACAVFAASARDIADPGVPVIRADDPRILLAQAAARFYGVQPDIMVAVTGTAGKTSVASFTRQIWQRAGLPAAMIGTTGVVSPNRTEYAQLTTPDQVHLHSLLKELAEEGVTRAAMEASSHGLDQHRLDGVRLTAGAFTNLGRDHLDYHADEEAYFAAKMRLFNSLLPPGSPAVIFSDDQWSGRAMDVARNAGLRVLTVGRNGGFLTLKRVEHQRHKQVAEIHHDGAIYHVTVPLAGDFQLSNALVAAGLAIATGVPPGEAIAALEHLQGAPGRLELVVTTDKSVPAYVDYAHKPEALEHVLRSVRPFTTGRIVLVFGCGGDRDRGKRPIMGDIAARLADVVIVTDDNPRSEDPAAIRAEILAAAPGAIEIDDRARAIDHAVSLVEEGDTLLVAGKGHEQGQTIGDKVLPFSDHEEIRRAVAALAERLWLWNCKDLVDAMNGRPVGNLPDGITGISIDSRSVSKGDAFFAIKGDRFDGHDFCGAARANGASVLVVSEAKLPAMGRLAAPMIVVNDVLEALGKLGVAARARSKAQIVAVTGSVGKTTTKEMLRQVLEAQGSVHASVASFNNHWGVPLTLARMPRDARFGVFEIGMNHAGEIRPLVKMVRPHVAVVTAIAAAHLGHFNSLDEIAEAKAEIFEGVESGGTALLNRDSEKFDLLTQLASGCGIDHVMAFGEAEHADIRLLSFEPSANGSRIRADIAGDMVEVSIGLPGRHIAQNALAVLGAAKCVGADVDMAARALGSIEAAEGRGVRYVLAVGDGRVTLIDESYNANPASMRAAIALLRDTPVVEPGRRIAVLGDMLELGSFAQELHGDLAGPLTGAGADLVLLAGPEIKVLADRLADTLPCQHEETADELLPVLLETIRPGDVIMIKSSKGIGFSRLVAALLDKYPPLSDGGSGNKSGPGDAAAC